MRTWGNSPDGAVVMLTGTYLTDGEVSRRLLDTLPPLTVLAAETTRIPVVELLADEVAKDDPGQTDVLDRLLDPAATVGGVARQVGYGSPFTFSTAFKRTYGASPRDYRDGAATRTA